jgi:hypothetical protein
MNTSKLISIAEHGRSVFEECSVKDDASALFEIFAAQAAQHESGKTHFRESICTDARY